MFKIRSVYQEKLDEIETSTKVETQVQSEESKDENKEEDSFSTENLSLTTSQILPSKTKLQTTTQNRSSSSVSNAIRPSNFEKGYESDLY